MSPNLHVNERTTHVTITEDKPDTDAVVSEPRPVAVGDTVYRESGGLHNALILHFEDGDAYVIGRHTEGGEFSFIKTSPVGLVRGSMDGSPGIPEIGALLVAKQATWNAALKAKDDATAEARAELLQVRNELTAAQSARASQLQTYKDKVRERIIANRDTYSWDTDEVNELLDECDLPRETRTFRVAVDVTATQSVYVEVEGTDLDDAMENLDSDAVYDAIDHSDWDVSSDWEIDRYNSEEL
jgi:hypothetical protein